MLTARYIRSTFVEDQRYLTDIFSFQNKSVNSWTCPHVRPRNTFIWQNKGLKYEKSGNMVPYISDFEQYLKDALKPRFANKFHGDN